MTSRTPQEELQKLFETGIALQRQGHFPQAETLYRAILAVAPQHADAAHLLGVLMHQTGRGGAAIEFLERAIRLDPRNPSYHFNLGVALQGLNEHARAADSYRRAVERRTDYTAAWENLGVALQDAGDADGARAAYFKALAIDGRSPLAHQNLGTLLLGIGRIAEAEQHFRAVLRLHPAHAEAHSKLASCLLAQGAYAEGWREYEWRSHSPSFTDGTPVRVIPFPKWDGARLAGKTLLIHPEQGLGEEVLFASCFADVLAQAERCIIECDPRLTPIFSRSFPQAHVLPCSSRREDFVWSEDLPAIDVAIAAGSLPRHVRAAAADFPAHTGYLEVDAARRDAFRRELDALGARLAIGVSWRGGRDPRSVQARSIALAEWRALFDGVDAAFVNLQYGDHAQEIAQFNASGGRPLHTLPGIDALHDLDGFTALIAALDLVISIDNSTVFLAGAVGTPVWVLLPANGEWRWRGAAGHSPWFPQARLFRRQTGDEWRAVLASVASALRSDALSGRKHPPAKHDVASTSPRASAAPTAGGALLVNDTRSWYHFGCSCTSLALHAELRARWPRVASLPIQRLLGISPPRTLAEFDDDAVYERLHEAHGEVIARLAEAEVVYVNGEGTLHGLHDQALTLLYLMHIARTRLQRRVHLFNHSCYPDDSLEVRDNPAYALYRRVYEQLDFIGVREPASARLLRSMGLNVTETFDCLPLFVHQQDLPAPVERRGIVIAGSVAWGRSNIVDEIARLVRTLHEAGASPRVLIGADAHMAADDVQFAAGLQQAAPDCFELFNATSEREWLRAIGQAELLVSGRFHHTIAAACLDTPFIVMESNTPKIAGLLERLESDSFVSVSEPDLAARLLARAQEIIAQPQRALVSKDVKERLLALARANF